MDKCPKCQNPHMDAPEPRKRVCPKCQTVLRVDGDRWKRETEQWVQTTPDNMERRTILVGLPRGSKDKYTGD